MKRNAINSARDGYSGVARMTIRIARWVVAAMVGLSLCSCALHHPPAHPAIVDQALPRATPLPPAWRSSPNSPNVDDDWLKSFHDKELESLVSEALANNLDLHQAAARVEGARQSVVVVGSKLNPQVNAPFSVATTHSTDKNVSELNQSSTMLVGASWEIDVWGRLRSQRAAAQENYEAIALDYAFARQSLAATTAKSWYLAIETRQVLALRKQSVEIYEKLLDLVKIRRAAGKVGDLDVAEANYQLDEALNQVTIAEGLYSEARRTIEVLVGRYPAAELEVTETFDPLPPPVAPGLPSSLLERRPDVVAAEHQVFSAFRTKESARLALLPNFSLNLEGGRLSDPLLSLLGLNPWLVHGALGMFLPIYQGGALRAKIMIATAEQEQSIAHFGGMALKAFTEVEVGLTNEELLTKRLPYTKNAVRDHSEAVRVANLKYKAGTADFLSVLQLQAGQIDSQLDLIQLSNAQLTNRINLHLALGGSFDIAPATTFPAVQAAKAH